MHSGTESYDVRRDNGGRFVKGSEPIPRSSKAIRKAAIAKFLDEVNGVAGEKRIRTLVAVAEGRVFVPEGATDAAPMHPSIREILDANLALIHMQHGKPHVTQDIEVSQGVSVQWDPDKYTNVEDLEKYLDLAKIGEVGNSTVDAEPNESQEDT